MSGLHGTPGEARLAGDLIRARVDVNVFVVCGFAGCPWSIEIGNAPLEAQAAYIEHLDVHDPDPDCESIDRVIDRSDEAIDELAAVCGLYAGDSPEKIAAEQARVDRFMAGGEDR